jgi:hypothetical protein
MVGFDEDVFGEEYHMCENISRPLHDRLSGIETPESHLPTLQEHVETFTGTGISFNCLVDLQGYLSIPVKLMYQEVLSRNLNLSTISNNGI